MSRISKRLQRLFLSFVPRNWRGVDKGRLLDDVASNHLQTKRLEKKRAYLKIGGTIPSNPPFRIIFGRFRIPSFKYPIFRKLKNGFFFQQMDNRDTPRCPMLNAKCFRARLFFVVNKKYIPPKKTCTVRKRWTCWCGKPSFGGFGAWFSRFFLGGGGGCRSGPKMVQPNQGHVDKRTPCQHHQLESLRFSCSNG